jgi:subtilisin family serine protease
MQVSNMLTKTFARALSGSFLCATALTIPSPVEAQSLTFRLAPSATASEATLNALSSRYGLSAAKRVADLEWQVEAGSATALAGVRDDPAVLWAERAEAIAPSNKLPGFHPRMLRVQLTEGALAGAELTAASAAQRWLPAFNAASSKTLQLARIRANALSVTVPKGATEADLGEAILTLSAHPDVASVERVRVLQPMATQPFAPFSKPNDPFFSAQWALTEPGAGIDAMRAWALAGTSPVTVAVLDTGYTSHPDLNAKWLPGYDFIHDRYVSVDGDGRDSDAADDGDFEDYGACGDFYDVRGSSWHGTHVAGIIAAQTNNGEGIAGVAPNARIVPVRVLGRCGGYYEDIADGIRWAAGAPVKGVPTNAMPATVLNLSLGGRGPCGADMQDAINTALARGASVVVSAGNEADDAQNYTPANCKGVITVAATNRAGNFSNYSNSGTTIEIAAPGGESQGFNQIVSTLNAGSVGASGSYYQPYQGTSMAAPHVAGTIALMLTRNPNLTPGQVLNILQATARDRVEVTDCGGLGLVCAVGRLNAGAAVAAVVDRRHFSEVTNMAGRVPLVELWNRTNNNFLLTSDLSEVSNVLAGKRGGDWVRSGQASETFDFTAQAHFSSLPQPVCRFSSPITGSVRYAVNQAECEEIAKSGVWTNEGTAFMASIANGGVCDTGSNPVYEFLADGRIRYAMSEDERRQSIRFGWRGGDVRFCIPGR